MKIIKTSIFLIAVLVSGILLITSTSSLAQEAGFTEETYKCDNGHAIRVVINTATNAPSAAYCIWPDLVETRALRYTNRTYFYTEVGGQPAFDFDFQITNAGPPPGSAICTVEGPPLFIYSNILYRCYRR